MSYRQLTEEERYKIGAMRGLGYSIARMAVELGRHRSTIYREIKRNHSRCDKAYRPIFAAQMARGRRSRSRRNLHYYDADFKPVAEQLRQHLSPEQISGRAKLLGLRCMSYETIYHWIKMDKEKGGSLWRCLRCARKQRRKRYGAYDSRGRLAGKKMIGERPAIVQERARFNDWEIDTVHGSNKSALVTLVERKSGRTKIGKLPRATCQYTLDRTTELLSKERHKPFTVTADNGAEFHMYKILEQRLHLDVYFATPHHAWERGTNENTNGLIRQYFPKGKSLDHVTQARCEAVAEKLNNRPRKRLKYLTPNEVYFNLEPGSLPLH
jgi:IS30 family transposase